MRCFLLLLCLFASVQVYGQSKPLLCKKWFYQKSKVLGVAYMPKSSESGDLLDLHADMTYRSVEDGHEQLGRWRFTPDPQVLVLEPTNGSQIQLRIEQLTAERFVYTLSFDGAHEVTFYMGSTQGGWSPPPASIPTEGRLETTPPAIIRQF
jgi:hypothetical protein